MKLDDATTAAIAPVQAKDTTALTVTDFIRLRRELKADIERDLEAADGSEKFTLRAQIADLETQIANPTEALATANKRIADLEDILDRAGNDIGGDRIIAAKAALEQGDYSIADDIFAEIEAREEIAVQNAARAAFGRGEVAEAQVRWHDAYTHFARSASLAPTYQHVNKARWYAGLSGNYPEAFSLGEKLVSLARSEDNSTQLAEALNNHAIGLRRLGRYPEAEGLYGEALKIDADTIGTAHPDYAIQLNNFASVVQDQGRYGEAEGLYREALKIDVDRIGTAHPAYATRLNNLGVNMYYQKKFTEARDLLEQALVIQKATLPADHPEIALTERSIAAVIAAAE